MPSESVCLQIWFSEREYKLLTELAIENCFKNPTQMWRWQMNMAAKGRKNAKGFESLGNDFICDTEEDYKMQIKFPTKVWDNLETIAKNKGFKFVSPMWKSIMLYQISKL
jgi:hypothetical protein